ncbi:hypothetical protein PoB_003840300 [Plakobranchus ocellatus]|uniref:Uncharacterized protein n=1 Tax=Plakobranchus ocellatus TaxID=259542 RepID=A0AAV4AYH7_9GAST|nr:hypothetical protein PoB_003840300 [Plakobranchus ocellatus]
MTISEANEAFARAMLYAVRRRISRRAIRKRHAQLTEKSANMKSLSVTLIGLLVLIAVTNAALETHLCVDMSHETPCKGWPAGLYPVCSGCGMGFFAECRGDEATVLTCPSDQGAKDNPPCVMFDNVTKTCVEKTDSCLEKKSCVDMADIEPVVEKDLVSSSPLEADFHHNVFVVKRGVFMVIPSFVSLIYGFPCIFKKAKNDISTLKVGE